MKFKAPEKTEAQVLDEMVYDFARAMRHKLTKKFKEGRRGWSSEDWSVDDIKAALEEHLKKGDPVDVANFAMFWWNRLSK